MAKDYGIKFGSGDPTSFSGLSPTFIQFRLVSDGSTLSPPSISELATGVGIYKFTYGPTIAVYFEADGGSALSSGDRYVVGILDPIQIIDQRIGVTSDSFGSTSADPSTLFGYAKRNQEFDEGNATFNKSTGVWGVFSRGSSTQLASKTLTNNSSTAGKA